MQDIRYRPIGVVRTPHKEVRGMPIQPVGALGVPGTVEVFEAFQPGLKDLEGFSHILLVYHLHAIQGFELRVTPYLGRDEHGIFATRAPKRPNPIGLSVLRLVGIEAGVLHVENVDMLDATPVLDIKPYVPAFDAWGAERIGWFEDVVENAATHEADDRFHRS